MQARMRCNVTNPFRPQNIIPVAFLILALLVVQTLPGVNDAPPEVHFTLDVSGYGV